MRGSACLITKAKKKPSAMQRPMKLCLKQERHNTQALIDMGVCYINYEFGKGLVETSSFNSYPGRW